MNIPIHPITDQPVSNSAASAWAFFDRIYCISLITRPDRQLEACRQFQSVGLHDRVQFIVVDKHPSDSEQGIYESHIACLQAGLIAGAKTILIFEDDVVFPHFSDAILQRAIDFMKSERKWKLFFLGCFVRSSSRTDFPSVVKVRFRHAAHAYAMGRNFAEQIVSQSWRGVAFDDLLREMDDGTYYSTYPSLAYQSNASTDNDKLRGLDRFRRVFGGTRWLQRCNEFFHHRMIEIIVAQLVVIMIVVLSLILLRARLR